MIDWAKSLEEDDPTTRIVVIHSTDPAPDLPPDVHLKYSRPPVERSARDGVVLTSGAPIFYPR